MRNLTGFFSAARHGRIMGAVATLHPLGFPEYVWPECCTNGRCNSCK